MVVRARLDGFGVRTIGNVVVMTMRLERLAPVAAMLVATACAGTEDTSQPPERPAADAQAREGRLSARPGQGGGNCRPGEHSLRVGGGREARMRVTAGARGGRKALILTLHGANSGGAGGGLYAFRGAWDVPGMVMVAPASAGPTWSFIRGRDEDLPVVNRALALAFARCRVDPARVAVGGFSDGATYALTLGIANGDLFRAVIALSAGGILAESSVGRPRVFIAHGMRDDVLPIKQTGDRIARTLRDHGYQVTYRRFAGRHEVRPEIARAAVDWFLRG
jgi:phospholipase/carboxylesterase